MISFLGLITSFIVTIVIEFIIYTIAIRKNIGKLLLYSLLINAFTWPLASLFIGTFLLNGFLFVEFLVFIVEFGLIMLLLKIKWWKALIISLIANFLTMMIGAVFGF